jgi:hypothetical protein
VELVELVEVELVEQDLVVVLQEVVLIQVEVEVVDLMLHQEDQVDQVLLLLDTNSNKIKL